MLAWIAMPSSSDFANPGMEPRSPGKQILTTGEALPQGATETLWSFPEAAENWGVGGGARGERRGSVSCEVGILLTTN